MFNKTMVLAVLGIMLISSGITGLVVLDKEEVLEDVVVAVNKEQLLEENKLYEGTVLGDLDFEEVVESNEAVEEDVETNDGFDEIIEEEVEEVITDPIVWNNMTRNQIVDQINLSLNSTISGKADVIVDQSLSLGVDPYLSTAIILHETGCKWECSYLVTSCNNVGGQKGSPSCNGGSYKYYATLDEGIRGVISNLYNNYYAYGLTLPDTIGPKYAADPTWSEKIWNYMGDIQSK